MCIDRAVMNRRRIEGERGAQFLAKMGLAVSVDVNPAAHFPFDVAVPPPLPPPRVDGGVAAELVSVNCNAFWPIRDYTMK